ncbi:MAG: hypothetical protein EPN50_05790 [Chloroflexota bacterium]|nr:MAG: hypothetical protein EPN50_05790 [Chloroflexota bacterium]
MIEVDSRATTWTAGGAVTQRGGGPRFEVAIGRHLVTLDQPAGEGGEDAGPTPTEAFVMSLAECA